MNSRLVRNVWILGGAAFVPLLGGCSGITYGTGVRAEMQTIEDIGGIASFTGKRKEDIEYKPRAGIVVPPTATLPPPGGDKKTADTNWPVDQDALARKIRNEKIAETNSGRTANPGNDPGFRLPKGATTSAEKTGDAEGFKALAAAKAARAGEYDASGKPVRRYLIEPPAEYRETDPSAPVVTATEAEKKKKRWWQFGS